MKYLKLILFILLCNIGYNQYLPYLGPDQTLSYKEESTTLTADLTQCVITNPNETTDYTLDEIPYIEQINNGITIIDDVDDVIVGPYNIGFNFCFYGQTYNQIWISDNGFIKFSPGWIGPLFTIPSQFTETNCIFVARQDWNTVFGGEVKYEIQGSAPFRKLIISWVDVNLQACYSYGTFHVILHETTNIIETHIKNKTNCLNNMFGLAIQGIHNQTGTQAAAVPGRNFTQWAAQNSSHKWAPSGNEIQPILTWYEIGNLTPIGTGTSITVTPPLQGASYTCHIEYPSCFSNWSNLTCLGPDIININYEFEDNTVLIPYIIEHPLIDSLIETPEQPTIGSICYVPNSFTPDGNEFNNVFKPIFNDVDLQYFNFTIYDRWGKVIYKSYDYFSYWDGTYNNTLCPIGIYLYEINFKINDKFYLVHGHVNLIK
jgi:gliding motility-associated-like protein